MCYRRHSLRALAAVHDRHLGDAEQLKPSETEANQDSEDLRDEVKGGDCESVGRELADYRIGT